MYNLEEIHKNYANFSDDRIIVIAQNEAKSLKKEVLSILIKEIKARDLDPDLITWIEAETRVLSTAELAALKQIVKNCLCPNCHQSRQLKGFQFQTFTGLLFTERVSEHHLIFCQNCGQKRRKTATIWTAVLGWWSVPGLLATPFRLAKKIKAYRQEDQLSEQTIESFLQDHIGIITLAKDTKTTIQSLLREIYTG